MSVIFRAVSAIGERLQVDGPQSLILTAVEAVFITSKRRQVSSDLADDGFFQIAFLLGIVSQSLNCGLTDESDLRVQVSATTHLIRAGEISGAGI
ncbi:MAG: hypothetical protein WAM73_15930 [Desulfobacterales bacterium]